MIRDTRPNLAAFGLACAGKDVRRQRAGNMAVSFCPPCLEALFFSGARMRQRRKVKPVVWDLIISDEAQDHIWDRHKIDVGRLLEIIENRSIMIPNRRGRTASHLLIGTDFSGQCYVVPVLPTDSPGTWEVITAWPCRDVDRDRLRRS